MAPWKTSTAGSARSTSTNSNRRQACLEAALRGAFSYPRLFPPRRAISFGTARYRFTLRASLCAHLAAFSSKSKKNEHRRHAISHGLGRKMPHSKSVSAFEFSPDECPHLFIPETLHRKAHANAKPPNEITPLPMVSKLYIFQQRDKEQAAKRRPGNKKRATP